MPKQRQQPKSSVETRSNSANVGAKGAQRPAQLRLKARTFNDLLAEQQELQEDALKEPQKYAGKYVTVGFEHEFAGMVDPILHGISHLQLAQSVNKLPYKDVPFSLETDSSNELELVNPPFLMETTAPGKPVPHPVDVDIAIRVIENRLYDIVQQFPTIQDLVSMLRADPGIHFGKIQADIKPSHLSHNTKGNFNRNNASVPAFDLRNIRLRPSEKHKSIMTQINFATDAGTYAEIIKNYPASPAGGIQGKSDEMVRGISEFLFSVAQNPAQLLFFTLLKRNLSEQMAVPAMEIVDELQQQEYRENGQIRTHKDVALFRELAGYTSNLKDRHRIWIKDSLMSVGAGILQHDDWQFIKSAITKAKGMQIETEGKPIYQQAADNMYAALNEICLQIEAGKTRPESIYQPPHEIEFLQHDPKLIGARQDTYVSPGKAQMPGIWNQRLHIAETRSQGRHTLAALQHGSVDAANRGVIDRDYGDGSVPYNLVKHGYFHRKEHDAFNKANPIPVIYDPIHGINRNFDGAPLDHTFSPQSKLPLMHYNPKIDMYFDSNALMYWDEKTKRYFDQAIGMYFNAAARKYISPDGSEELISSGEGKYRSNVREEVYNPILRIWEKLDGSFIRLAKNDVFSNPDRQIDYNPLTERKSLTPIHGQVTLLVDAGSRFREVVVGNGAYMHEVPFPGQKRNEPLINLQRYKYVKILDAAYNQIAEGEMRK